MVRSGNIRGDRTGFGSQVILDLVDGRRVENINGVRGRVEAGDTGISHDGDTGAYFTLCHGSFIGMRECVVATQLVTHFMRYVVDIKIISLRNTISRRCDASSFRRSCTAGNAIYTNTTDTTGVSTSARSAEHMANVIRSVINIDGCSRTCECGIECNL